MTPRRLLFQVHLYAGLTVGALLAMIGLSGSVLAFGEELERQLHPELLEVQPQGSRVPLEEVVARVQRAQGAPPRLLHLHERPEAPLEAWMDPQGSVRVYLNPYSGALLGTRTAESSLVGSLREVHVSLLAGDSGKALVGLSGLVLIALCLSGLVLWWPGRRKLAEGLALRRPLRWRRGNFDIHKLAGLASLGLLLLAGLTGSALAFPKPFSRALQLATGSPAPASPPTSSTPTSSTPTGAPLPLDTLLAAAEQALPGARTVRIHLPASPTEPLRVRKRLPQELHPNGMSFVYVERSTGAVLRTDNALHAPLSARLMALRYPLHIGAWGGLATRLLTALSGLFPAALFLTGFFLWLSRLRQLPVPRPAPPLAASRGSAA